jgi:hypothetical protein
MSSEVKAATTANGAQPWHLRMNHRVEHWHLSLCFSL